MHKTMVSVASLEKIVIIRSQELMPSEARLKFLKKMIILGPKTAILGPQFCRILVLGPHFWWLGGAQAAIVSGRGRGRGRGMEGGGGLLMHLNCNVNVDPFPMDQQTNKNM